MITCNIGIEAEVFIKNREGEIIAPSYNLPLDGNGILLEIRGNPDINPEKCVENFYRQFEYIKGKIEPNSIYISSQEIIKTKQTIRRAYSYKNSDAANFTNMEIHTGLHIHINVLFFNIPIRIKREKINTCILNRLHKEIFDKYNKYIPRKDYKTYTSDAIREKKYTEKIYGFEYRSLEMSENILLNLPNIVKDINNIIKDVMQEDYYSEIIPLFNMSNLKLYKQKLDMYIMELYKIY